MGRGTKEPAISTPISHIDKVELQLTWYNAGGTRKFIQISLCMSFLAAFLEESFLPKMQLNFKECSLRYITLQH